MADEHGALLGLGASGVERGESGLGPLAEHELGESTYYSVYRNE